MVAVMITIFILSLVKKLGTSEGLVDLSFLSTSEKVAKTSELSECRLEGKVVKVTDGDSITVLDSNEFQHKIRLSGVDAPEKGQPYSKAATKYLSSLIRSKSVCVDWHKRDNYFRLVGVVRYQGQDINLLMVESGFAWHYKKYKKEQSPSNQVIYANAETNSRLSVIGLWQEPDPIKPSEWRAGKRKEKFVKATKKSTNTGNNYDSFSTFSCGAKRFCKQMQSCAEACFYLTQCGYTRLDSDKDGIPCETFCGGC